MSNKRKVLIIGYGEMGHAMRYLLDGTCQIAIHDVRPVEGLEPIDLEREVASADFIFFCVPAQPLAKLLKQIGPGLQWNAICLSISKGLDDRGRTAAQIYHQSFHAGERYGLLYGPMISEEILAGRFAFAELGCSDDVVCAEVRALLRESSLAIRRSKDMTGICWSVILKNVYAIAFGATDELGFGDNVRGFLTVTAMEELRSIVSRMGGRPATPLRLAGLGDLITTATSKGSHHHELGIRLARGESDGISGEGIHTLEMVEKYALFDTTAYPLFSLIQAMVSQPGDVEAKINAYLASLR